MKISIDAAVGAVFIGKLINEATILLEDMSSNNYHLANEKGNPKKGGRYDVNAFNMLVSKVDALFQKVDCLQLNPSNG